MKFATKPIDIIHLTIVMLPHYIEKLQIQIFYRYSPDMEKNANKLHFKCTDFNSSTYTLSIHSYTRRWIKIGAFKVQFV